MDHIAHTHGKWLNAGWAKLFDNGYSKLNDKQIHKMAKIEAIKRVPWLNALPDSWTNSDLAVKQARLIADNKVKGMTNDEKAAVLKQHMRKKIQEAVKRLSQTFQK